jgi:RNA recognition motif-containing protein
MSTRLYIGNLPFSADENQLRTLCAQEGRHVTSVSLVTDRESGRPRGFGFVDMANDADAQSCIDSLNGVDFGGRSLTVTQARQREARHVRF